MKDTVPASSQGFFNLIGIPYEKAHCWDLCKLFYAQVFNRDLRYIYDGAAPHDKKITEKLIATNKGYFKRVDSPEFGDLVLIAVFGIESHIAIYVGNGRLLHTSERLGSHIDRVAKYDKVIVGFYRHVEGEDDQG